MSGEKFSGPELENASPRTQDELPKERGWKGRPWFSQPNPPSFSLFDSFDWRFRLKIVTQLQAGSATSDAGSCVITAGCASCPCTVRVTVTRGDGAGPAGLHQRAQPGARSSTAAPDTRATATSECSHRCCHAWGRARRGLWERGQDAGGEAARPRLATCWTSGQPSNGHWPHQVKLELLIQDQSASLRARAPQIVGISLKNSSRGSLPWAGLRKASWP